MEATAGGLAIVWVLLGLFVAILWILMPFAIFGTKPILSLILAEQKRTNDLLQAQLDRDRLGSAVRVRERYIRISKFVEGTDYTAWAVETKIQRGVWLEGHEYRRAPDGALLIDMQGYERCVERAPHQQGSPSFSALT